MASRLVLSVIDDAEAATSRAVEPVTSCSYDPVLPVFVDRNGVASVIQMGMTQRVIIKLV